MAISQYLEFQKFTDLLKRRYGITPADVGIDDLKAFCDAAPATGRLDNQHAEVLVEQLAEKYGLQTLTEMST